MYRKSSYSQGASNCIETASYRKASASNGNDGCIEAGNGDQVVAVRDTKQEHLGDERTVLEISPGAWIRFTDSLKEDVQ